MMLLSELLETVPGIVNRPEPSDPHVTAGITEDSREVRPGSLFVARMGGSFDGHRYIEAAVANGAAAVVGERAPYDVTCAVPYVQVASAAEAMAHMAAAYHGFPSRKLTMIGVTGTDGKTTTSNLIFTMLRQSGFRVGMISTINAVIGDEELSTGLHVTTPTAPEIQSYLARMVDTGLTHCVLEATSHGLAQHRATACDFDIAVVTNIQHEHLDFHGSWEGYRDAKAMLFKHLSDGMRKPGIRKVAVINLDDTPSAAHLLAIPADQHITYAVDGAADVVASDVSYQASSTKFAVRLPDDGMVTINTPLVGTFNVSNILAAISAGVALGLTPAQIKSGVEALSAISGRMQRIDEGQEFIAVVDFAHTPNALRVALQAGRLMTPDDGRVIVVFGSAGLRDPEKRAMMGRIAGQMADIVVVTAEDPRTESLDDILEASTRAAVEAGAVEGRTLFKVPDRGRAIHFAVGLARAGDIVLACGKGHEQSMCFGTTEYPWDDRDAMRSALRGAPLLTLPTAEL